MNAEGACPVLSPGDTHLVHHPLQPLVLVSSSGQLSVLGHWSLLKEVTVLKVGAPGHASGTQPMTDSYKCANPAPLPACEENSGD